MEYDVLEPALSAWVATLTGVDPLVVVWENVPRPRHNGVLVLLSWLSATKLGTDDAAWVYSVNPDPLAEMVPEVGGPRVLSLQVSVETHDQRPGRTARAVAERLRDRVRLPSSVAALQAANLGLVQATSVTQSDYRVDTRVVSRALLELTFNASAFVRDTAGATSYIAGVQTSASITNVDGTALPASIQPSGSLP